MKCVLDLMAIEEGLPADVQDHRPVAFQEQFEGRLITVLDESLQDLPIGHSRERPVPEHTRHLPECIARASFHHQPRFPPLERSHPLRLIPILDTAESGLMNRNANLIYAADFLSNPRFSVFPGDSPAAARETSLDAEEMGGLGRPC